MITDNIATVLTNLFIGYYGKTAHKPRWMSIGCVVTGLSVLITALPYFIYGPAQEADLELVGNMTLVSKSKNGDQMCLLSEQKEDCSSNTASAAKTMTMVAVSCFAISNFFRGFGTSIYFTYGTPYLDDNVSKAKMPTFFAFIFAARIMGAPIGFYLSSVALKFYENPFAVPSNLVDTDPRWIGAWWIGFLVSGTLMLLLAIPLSFFPREFKRQPKKDGEIQEAEGLQLVNRDGANGSQTQVATIGDQQQQVEKTPISSQIKGEGDETEGEEGEKKAQNLSLRELPGEIMAIITNPIIICQMMGNLFRGIGIIGYFVFQTKYLEAQFKSSASKASLVSGTTGFMAKIFGVLFGGLLITLCRPKPRVLTTFIFFVELTSVFTLLYGASIMGPHYEYPETIVNVNQQLDLNNDCNKNCFCERARFQPVCELASSKPSSSSSSGDFNKHQMMLPEGDRPVNAYFSPCHAGCRNSYKTIDGGSAFTECNCMKGSVKVLEKCPPDINKLMKYATIVALGGMISGSSRPGNMVTFFRSINPEQKSLAVAVGSFWHSLFVSIPYPIIYGKIFDYSCLVWSRECTKRGNCWLYDTDKLRYIYHAVSIALIALGSVFDLIMIFLSPRLGALYDDDGKTLKDRLRFWESETKRRARKAADTADEERDSSRPELQVSKL